MTRRFGYVLWIPKPKQMRTKNWRKVYGTQETFLRRLGLGLQFGIDVDLDWAEREVERHTDAQWR